MGDARAGERRAGRPHDEEKEEEVHCITGGFGFSGRFLAYHLHRQNLQEGGEEGGGRGEASSPPNSARRRRRRRTFKTIRIRTLTNSPRRRHRQSAPPRRCPHYPSSSSGAAFAAAEGNREVNAARSSTEGDGGNDGSGVEKEVLLPLEDPPALPDGCMEVFPLCFDDPSELVRALRGVDVLYNTYWVRFSNKGQSKDDSGTRGKEQPAGEDVDTRAGDPSFSHDEAVQNTLALFQAAKEAGVRRIVHVSISNPTDFDRLPYFRGKLQLERALAQLGVPEWVILRPAVFFGAEDILVNNIAWTLRHFPFTMVPWGACRLQPIHVDDFAKLMLDRGLRSPQAHQNEIVDAVGPEVFTLRELNQLVAREVPSPFSRWDWVSRLRVVPVPPAVMVLVGWIMGVLLRDQMLTADEVEGLMADLLVARPGAVPPGTTRLSGWIRSHRDTLGLHYASEMARRRDRTQAYADLYQPDVPLGSGSRFVLVATIALTLATYALFALAVFLAGG